VPLAFIWEMDSTLHCKIKEAACGSRSMPRPFKSLVLGRMLQKLLIKYLLELLYMLSSLQEV